ncbi:MAG: 5-oxoprolinase subunit PxpB [Candidatus Limnocylindrales bacterium]
MISAFGDEAMLVVFGEAIDRALNRRAHALAQRIREPNGAGWGTPVPGYASVLVPFDPSTVEADVVTARLAKLVAEVQALEAMPANVAATDPRSVAEIPVRYGGLDGPDLRAVAERTDLTPAQVIEAHASTVYDVYLLGFVPGFAYLGTLPPEIVLPRRDEPRARVPAGSVAIAGRQTAVYPSETPGGWHLLGRTDASMWDARRVPSASLAAGQRVRFVPTATSEG